MIGEAIRVATILLLAFWFAGTVVTHSYSKTMTWCFVGKADPRAWHEKLVVELLVLWLAITWPLTLYRGWQAAKRDGDL